MVIIAIHKMLRLNNESVQNTRTHARKTHTCTRLTSIFP